MTTVVHGIDELKGLVGQDLGYSDWLEITQERVNTFADATDDHQWIHVDVARAEEGPFHAPIAHGYLTLSLVIPLFAEVLKVEGTAMGVNYGLDRVRFPNPVPVGSRVRLRGSVVSVDDIEGGAQLAVDLTIEIDGVAKPACVARGIYRHYTAPAV
jgi:acyl dehydratase